MKIVIVLTIVFGVTNAYNSFMVHQVTKKFKGYNPILIHSKNVKEQRKSLLKGLSKEDILVNLKSNFKENKRYQIVLETKERSTFRPRIDQQVYFVSNNGELSERYEINGKMIENCLGHFDNETFELEIEPSVFNSFLRRRANFDGLDLIAMTEAFPPESTLPKNFESLVPFHSENNTFEVTSVVTGVHIDILTILGNELNFTQKIYKRKDGNWGIPKVWPNGTITLGGMLQNVGNDGKAELITGAFGNFYSRFVATDFLQPLSECNTGMFIKSSGIQEDYDFETFFKPFDVGLWLAIAITTIIFACSSLTFKAKCFPPLKLLKAIIEKCWEYFQPFLGSSIEENEKPRLSYRILTLTILLAGFTVWTSYTAFLTSELAVPSNKLPFEDLESLSKTNYKVYTFAKGTGVAQFLSTAKSAEKVFLNNMDESSFISPMDALLAKVLNGTKTVYYGDVALITYNVKAWSKLQLVWMPRPSLFACTMGIRKGSPYKEFLDWKIGQLRDSGALQIIKQRYELIPPTVESNLENPISWKKLGFLWICIFTGFIASVMILPFERFRFIFPLPHEA